MQNLTSKNINHLTLQIQKLKSTLYYAIYEITQSHASIYTSNLHIRVLNN